MFKVNYEKMMKKSFLFALIVLCVLVFSSFGFGEEAKSAEVVVEESDEQAVTSSEEEVTTSGQTLGGGTPSPEKQSTPSKSIWKSPSTYGEIFNSVIGTASAGNSMLDIMYTQEELQEQQREYDKALQELIMPGSYEYYMSSVCNSNIPTPTDGYAYVEDSDGNIRTAASVSAEKQFYTEYNETDYEKGDLTKKDKYIYKISYLVTNYNMDNVTVNYRVSLRDPGVRYMTESTKLKLEEEDEDLIVEVLDSNYERVCIEFSGTVPRAGAYLMPDDSYKEVENPFCNRIEWVGIESTTYSAPEYD